MHVEQDQQEHPEALLDRALRGTLCPDDQATLDRHLAECAECALEIEAARLFAVAVAPDKQDDALNRGAVKKALDCLQDEALDRVAVDGALARLEKDGTIKPRARLGPKLRQLLGLRGWLRPAAGLAFVGAAAIVIVGLTTRQPSPLPAIAQAPATRTLILGDGSEVAPLDGKTTLQVAEQSAARTTLRLRAGGAQFRIRHDSRRIFRVEAGPLEIEDLGTVFRVEHQSGDKIHVAVAEGRVAVRNSSTQLHVELGAGEDRVFATAAEPSPVSESVPEAPKPAATASPPAAVRGPSHARGMEDPAGLLAAADLARRSHDPRAAVAPLRRLLERYPRDPRAAAAAFTLGWVLLTDLGRAREAAATFAEAERIAPRGALAEDAAARVAEAWQKAGDSHRAAEAARHYEQLYPTGRYVTLMRGLLGEH